MNPGPAISTFSIRGEAGSALTMRPASSRGLARAALASVSATLQAKSPCSLARVCSISTRTAVSCGRPPAAGRPAMAAFSRLAMCAFKPGPCGSGGTGCALFYRRAGRARSGAPKQKGEASASPFCPIPGGLLGVAELGVHAWRQQPSTYVLADGLDAAAKNGTGAFVTAERPATGVAHGGERAFDLAVLPQRAFHGHVFGAGPGAATGAGHADNLHGQRLSRCLGGNVVGQHHLVIALVGEFLHELGDPGREIAFRPHRIRHAQLLGKRRLLAAREST